MIFGTCKRCGQFVNTVSHVCAPLWKVWRPEYGESEADALEVVAPDARKAAELFCKLEDEKGDYCILRDREATVKVRSDRGGPVFTVSIEARSVPKYSATKCTEEPSTEESDDHQG